MTCIIGVVEEGKVYIGGDSAGVAGFNLECRTDCKVFRNGPMLLGFTSSFRMGQLLRYALKVPEHPEGMSNMEYMTTLFVDAVRQCLKDGGYAKKTNEEESAGTFIVGYRGELFKVENDYQVGQTIDPFMATGSGEQVALGYLHATREGAMGYEYPVQRIMDTLDAVQRFNAAVRAPFIVEELGEAVRV